jgi:predicted PurR-regulated permease PerM
MMPAPFMPPPEDWSYLRRLGYTIVLAAALLVLWRAANLLMLAFGSVLGAVVFRSTARTLQRMGLRNWTISLVLGTLLVLMFFGAIGYLLTVQFGAEIGGMLGNLPGTLQKIESGLSSTPVGKAVVEAARVGTGGGAIAKRLASLVSGAGEVLLNLVIVTVGAMFIAVDPRPYTRGLVLLSPAPARPTMERALHEISMALRLWLKAKLISMMVMTVTIGASLWWAGLKSWAALGLLGGLSEFVPYVGPAVAMLPSIGIAATVGNAVLLRTVVAYLVIRVFEGWLLTPFINRSVVSIPPALTLFTILGAGAVLGFYGLFFAGALLVVAFVAVREFYLRDTLGEAIEGVPRRHGKEEGAR